jgi:hypothetical protein
MFIIKNREKGKTHPLVHGLDEGTDTQQRPSAGCWVPPISQAISHSKRHEFPISESRSETACHGHRHSIHGVVRGGKVAYVELS